MTKNNPGDKIREAKSKTPIVGLPEEKGNLVRRFLWTLIRHGGFATPILIKTENAVHNTNMYRVRDGLKAAGRIDYPMFGVIKYTPTEAEITAAKALVKNGASPIMISDAKIYMPSEDDLAFANAVIKYAKTLE